MRDRAKEAAVSTVQGLLAEGVAALAIIAIVLIMLRHGS